MRQQVWPSHPFCGHQRRQRHHRTLAGARIQPREIIRALAELRLRLENDEPRAAELIELTHGYRAKLRLDRSVDVLYRHTEKFGFLAIHFHPQLLRRSAESGAHARGDFRSLPRLGDDLLRELIQARGIARCRILHPEFESARRSYARNRRRRERRHDTALDVPRLCEDTHQQCPRVLLLGGGDGGVALLEVFEGHEQSRGIGLKAAVDQTEPSDLRAIFHPRRFGEKSIDLRRHLLRAVQARRIGHDDRCKHITLILLRHEAGRAAL